MNIPNELEYALEAEVERRLGLRKTERVSTIVYGTLHMTDKLGRFYSFRSRNVDPNLDGKRVMILVLD